VSIGGTSPSGFKSDRAFDIAGFKLAGLLQQVLGAHIAVKVSPPLATGRKHLGDGHSADWCSMCRGAVYSK
jgi:hypothetical protein